LRGSATCCRKKSPGDAGLLCGVSRVPRSTAVLHVIDDDNRQRPIELADIGGMADQPVT